MNTYKTLLRTLAIGACLSAGAARADGQFINIQAEIDGRSQLILDGDTVQWHHFSWAAPGRHFCNVGEPEEPTLLNGVEWFPVWPDVPDCENRECNCDSDVFVGLTPPIPEFEYTPTLDLILCRGDCFLVETPTAANGYRVVIEFFDNASGPAWYEIELGLPCGATNYCESTPNSSGAPAIIGMRGSLSVAAADMVLEVTNCPADTFGVFFYGRGETQYPLGDGYLCVSPYSPGLFRMLPVAQTDPNGFGECPMNFASPPPGGEIEPGSSWNIQFWFRDIAAQGTGTNLSDALRAVFCP
jgi:hypothetical protein